MVGVGKTKNKNFERGKMSPQNIYAKWNPKKKIHAWTKTNQATMASGEEKMAAKHYTRLLNFLLNRAFLSVLRKNAAWIEVSHIFRNVFLEKYSTFKGDIWPFCSTCSTNRSVACYILCFKLLNSGEFKKKVEIWRQILRYRFFCVFKLEIFHLANLCRILNKRKYFHFPFTKNIF